MKNLEKIVNKFNKAKVLVIGDLILDEYIIGNVERISPEAPVPIVWANKSSYVPGGAANVAYNIRALGGSVCLAGVVGRDENSTRLLSRLKKGRIATSGIFAEAKRPTTLKTRIIAGHQQVVRVDWEHTKPLAKSGNRKILDFARKNIRKFDCLIIEDYGKGVVNAQLLKELTTLAASSKKIITVDPKEDHFQFYRGVNAITPNRKELENAVRNLKIKDRSNSFRADNDRLSTVRDINRAAKEIIKYLGLESLLVTLGEEGMYLLEKNSNKSIHIPTMAQEVYDVSGAGDTVISVFSLALACGAKKEEAAYLANYAAGVVVGKLGTATASRSELLTAIKAK